MFVLGGVGKVAEEIRDKLNTQAGRTFVVGAYSPPMDFENNEVELAKILSLINATNANILAVALGTPKQEKWIYKNYKELGVPVSMGVGGTFEFISGMVKRAPIWMQKIGLEWFWRLMMEPGRLWKRYLVHDMKFFWLVLKQRFKKPDYENE